MHYLGKDAIKEVFQSIIIDGSVIRTWIRAFKHDIFKLNHDTRFLHSKNDELSKQVETLEKQVRLLFVRTENKAPLGQ